MEIRIGDKTFRATLSDNETAAAFEKMLPMSVTMTEHAGNEKFYDLPGNLPTDHKDPGTINNGDVMLYGSNTLVLFYKTFATRYRYTRIAKVDDPDGLEVALGTGSVTVKFALTD